MNSVSENQGVKYKNRNNITILQTTSVVCIDFITTYLSENFSAAKIK